MRDILGSVCELVEGNLDLVEERRYEITWKPDGSPVTTADVFVEHMVEEHLTGELPGLTFLGEETYRSYTPQENGWAVVLDPIDGTENFCSGLKEWGLALSIWRGPHHHGSLLLLPELGERLMTGDDLTPVSSRITGFSSTISPEVVAGLADAGEARILGCAVYNLYNVIRGSFRRFVNPVGAYSWDLLAGVQLALEHGCYVEIDGEPYAGWFLEPGRKYRVDVRHRHADHPGEGAVG